MPDELMTLLAGRRGHFLLESGHHGDVWFDLDRLFLRPARLRGFVVALAARLARHPGDMVCGPLIGGAFVAQMIATELDLDFIYAERAPRASSGALYSVGYHIPPALGGAVTGKRVIIVDDVINAGSAVQATLRDLQARGGRPVAIGALLTLGVAASRIAATQTIPLESIASHEAGLWAPPDCPLCAAGIPLEDVTGRP